MFRRRSPRRRGDRPVDREFPHSAVAQWGFALDKRAKFLRDSVILKKIIRLLLLFAFTCLLATVPTGRAVVPPPDGGYPGGNTEKGEQASELRNVSAQLQINNAAAQAIASNRP